MGVGVMSPTLMLAVRSIVLKPFLGGPDKMYRLHKWLGITGLVMVVLHWLGKQLPSWLTGLGLMGRHAGEHNPEPTAPVFLFFQSLRGAAESIGVWAFYAAMLLMAPTLALGGSVSAVIILLRRVGLNRRAVGVVRQVNYHKEVRVLEVAVQLRGCWSVHQGGQFVFVTFDRHEGAHPFTISSAWSADGHMVFLIKELGDYTRVLPASLKVGDPVEVEGPYGQFNFNSDCARQIWVGGGIGVRPFVARLEELKVQPHNQPVDLFYATASPYNLAIHKLRRLAREAGVAPHVLVEAKDGRLTARCICKLVPNWKLGDLWFYGPTGFGHAW